MTADQRHLLRISALAAATALLFAAGFTLGFAGRLPLVWFVTATIWGLLLIGLVWSMALLRLHGRRLDPFAIRPRLVAGSGAVATTMLYVGLALGWLLVAHRLAATSIGFRLHWPLQVAGALVFLLHAKRQLIARQPARPARQSHSRTHRERTLSAIALLEQSSWLADAAPGSAGARLRAALGWWREELDAILPTDADTLGSPAIANHLDEVDRQLDLLRALAEHDARSDAVLTEAEARVLAAIERAGHLMESVRRYA